MFCRFKISQIETKIMKRVKIESEAVKSEDAETEEGVEVGPENMQEFEAAVHDRCSNNLSMVTYKWVQRSHLLHVGTPVIIVDERSMYRGRRGAVEKVVSPGLMFDIRVWDDDTSTKVRLHRTKVKRAGITMSSSTVPPDAGAM